MIYSVPESCKLFIYSPFYYILKTTWAHHNFQSWGKWDNVLYLNSCLGNKSDGQLLTDVQLITEELRAQLIYYQKECLALQMEYCMTWHSSS